MRPYLIFTGKELREHMRTFRLPILAIVFIFFGILSPATAKYTPELLKMLGTGDSGITITVGQARMQDSYVQFFKNMTGVGNIILLLVFAGLVANEKAKGQASLILTKNLSRPAFLLAKFSAAAVVWTAIYAAGALVCQGYTLWFFPGETASNLLPAFAAYWLYGVLILAFTLLASSLTGSYALSALGAFALWGVLMLSVLPASIAKYTPQALGSLNVAVVQGASPAGDLLAPALIAAGFIIVALGLGSWLLSKQEL